MKRKDTDVKREIRVPWRPVAIGFGISAPERAERMAQYADGVIVGSAIVQFIARYGRATAPYVAQHVRSMKRAISRE